MSDDDEISIPASGSEPEEAPTGRSRAELDGMIETLWNRVQAQQAQIDRLQKKITALEDDQEDNPRLARWLPFPPPPAAEDKQYRGESPLFTIGHFVQYYNAVYVGKPGTRAVAIPDCWLEHPALIAELATLTYTWRAAHIGKSASARDAQYWHDRWRVGFAERLATEWVHPHCLTDGHKVAGATPLIDRYTLEQQERAQAQDGSANPSAPHGDEHVQAES
ncbi:hypothetical protein [Amycolatopsis anabasis]|uniref:hypothetical protein n=1 Tax=Amycolatopsis anabasis TaxID=1840409 RepID=UPI00131C13BE|nr:hypothetical protein [Amycolatopsis anabasis]